MAALVAAYRASPEWRQLAPGSRTDYNKTLKVLETRFGGLAVRGLPRQFVFKLRDEYSTLPVVTKHNPPRPVLDAHGKQVVRATPRRANGAVNVLRLLLAWAQNRGGWVKENVALRPGRLQTGPGHTMWTPENVRTFLASAPEPICRAAVLAIYTGQRKEDCLTMTPAQRSGGRIEVVQGKTGARLSIPEHPELTRVLDAAPAGGERLLTRADGKPWKIDNFNHAFAAAVRAAGLAGLKFHGLRKTTSGWLAEDGATDAEIDSVLGHVDPKMTVMYRRQANQRVRADAAMGKLAGRRVGPIDKPLGVD